MERQVGPWISQVPLFGSQGSVLWALLPCLLHKHSRQLWAVLEVNLLSAPGLVREGWSRAGWVVQACRRDAGRWEGGEMQSKKSSRRGWLLKHECKLVEMKIKPGRGVFAGKGPEG